MPNRENEVIEIAYNGIRYRSIGKCCILIDYHWPNVGDFVSFQSEDPSIKICVLGALFKDYSEDKSLFNEIYGSKLFKVCNDNKNTFSKILHKWFDRGWEGIIPKVFIDFIYTITDRPIDEDEAGKGEDLHFENGDKIIFKNKSQSWDDIFDQYLVPVDVYKDVLTDIETLEKLFSGNSTG